MNHPTDSVRLEGPAGAIDLNCNEYGILWPPPAEITHIGGEPLDIPMVLVSRSELADNDPELLAGRVSRAALYLPLNQIED